MCWWKYDNKIWWIKIEFSNFFEEFINWMVKLLQSLTLFKNITCLFHSKCAIAFLLKLMTACQPRAAWSAFLLLQGAVAPSRFRAVVGGQGSHDPAQLPHPRELGARGVWGWGAGTEYYGFGAEPYLVTYMYGSTEISTEGKLWKIHGALKIKKAQMKI